MPFNLMNGLMAGSAAGNGFFQGQDQAQQQQLQRQQQQMAMLMNSMKLQEEQRNMGYADSESAYAKQLATDPDTMDLPMDQKMDLLTKNALGKGDLVRANQFATNATNFRQEQVNQDQKRMAIQTGQINNQQKLHQYMGSELAAAADGGRDEFDRAKMEALSSGMGTPEEQKKLASLEWDPDLGRRLRKASMTSQQQSQTLLKEQGLNQQKKNQDLLEQNREINQQIREQRLKLQEDEFVAKQKAGGVAKEPTKQELEDATSYLKDSGLDPKTQAADIDQLRQSLVGTKKALQKQNPNLPEAQAFAQAAKLIIPQDTKSLSVPTWRGLGSDKKEASYKMAGATPQQPIPYDGNKATLIPGRYYQTGSHGVMQFTGTGFVPVQ